MLVGALALRSLGQSPATLWKAPHVVQIGIYNEEVLEEVEEERGDHEGYDCNNGSLLMISNHEILIVDV